MSADAMVEWLRQTEAVEVRTFAHEWGVWVTNGKAGDDWDGTLIARCMTDTDAQLVATALAMLRRGPVGTLDTAWLMHTSDRDVDDVELPDTGDE